MKQWSLPVTNSEAARRAGGRRRINAERQRQAAETRRNVQKMIAAGIAPKEVAKALDIHLATVYRHRKPRRSTVLDLLRRVLGT